MLRECMAGFDHNSVTTKEAVFNVNHTSLILSDLEQILKLLESSRHQ